MIPDPVFRSLTTFTQAEFVRWLEGLPAHDLHHYELLEGLIVREPPAGWPHGHVAMEIGSRLAPFVRQRRLGLVFDSSQGFELGTGDVVEPDVSFVSSARWDLLARPIRGFPTIAPDLVFEVLSPAPGGIDRTQKKRIYERNQVLEYALVDCEAQTFDVFRWEAGAYAPGQLLAAGERFVSRVMPGFRLRISDVFSAA